MALELSSTSDGMLKIFYDTALDEDGVGVWDDAPRRSTLKFLATYLPEICHQTLKPSSSTGEVQKTCRLLLVLLRGKRCPHSHVVFESGAPAILLPILRCLMRLLVSPAHNSTSGLLLQVSMLLVRLASGRHTTFCQRIFSDIVTLLFDVSVLRELLRTRAVC
jgi:hypothetical protein